MKRSVLALLQVVPQPDPFVSLWTGTLKAFFRQRVYSGIDAHACDGCIPGLFHFVQRKSKSVRNPDDIPVKIHPGGDRPKDILHVVDVDILVHDDGDLYPWMRQRGHGDILPDAPLRGLNVINLDNRDQEKWEKGDVLHARGYFLE